LPYKIYYASLVVLSGTTPRSPNGPLSSGGDIPVQQGYWGAMGANAGPVPITTGRNMPFRKYRQSSRSLTMDHFGQNADFCRMPFLAAGAPRRRHRLQLCPLRAWACGEVVGAMLRSPQAEIYHPDETDMLVRIDTGQCGSIQATLGTGDGKRYRYRPNRRCQAYWSCRGRWRRQHVA
jgi:hypothetical protein